MRVIYIDSYFLMNLAVNFLLILATAKICALRTRYIRFLLASAFGAAYAAAVVIPGVPDLVSLLPLRIAAGVLLALIAFGSERRFGRYVIILFALAACFAGTSMIVGIVSFRAVLLVAALTYALITAALKFAAAKREPSGTAASVRLRIDYNGKGAEFRVLRDTGNSLRDPGSGEILPVVNYAEVASLFSPEVRAILGSNRNAADKFSELRNLREPPAARLIPYRAVGVESGLLVCFRADAVFADGSKRESKWAAISPTAINSYGGVL